MGSSGIGQVLLPVALFSIMFGVGMSLHLKAFSLLWQRPVIVAVAVLTQILFLPALAFLVVSLFQVPAVLAVGIMVLSFAPGGATSNMITYLCKGDTVLSVCITAISGLITPFTMPILTMLAISYWLGDSTAVNLPVAETVAKLFLIAVIPVFLGALVHYQWPHVCQKLEVFTKALACLFLIIVVIGIVKANLGTLPSYLLQVAPAVLCLVTVAMLSGYSVAKFMGLASEQKLTYAIEIGIQNAAAALVITSAILHNSEMSASALIYGILMNIPAFMLIIWRNWPVLRSKARTVV